MVSPRGAWRGPVNSNQVPGDHGTAPYNVTTAIIGLRRALCPLRWDTRGDFDMGALWDIKTVQNGNRTSFWAHQLLLFFSI
jgi:hypothetical protein